MHIGIAMAINIVHRLQHLDGFLRGGGAIKKSHWLAIDLFGQNREVASDLRDIKAFGIHAKIHANFMTSCRNCHLHLVYTGLAAVNDES